MPLTLVPHPAAEMGSGAGGGLLGKLAKKTLSLGAKEKRLQELSQPVFAKACMDLVALDKKRVFYGTLAMCCAAACLGGALTWVCCTHTEPVNESEHIGYYSLIKHPMSISQLRKDIYQEGYTIKRFEVRLWLVGQGMELAYLIPCRSPAERCQTTYFQRSGLLYERGGRAAS